MFDVAPTELLMVALVALVVIGPKDLPNAMRFVGRWVAKAQGVARHFRSGLDEMVRQAELEDMEKKWAAENERIMREHPTAAYAPSWDDPAPTTPAPVLTGPETIAEPAPAMEPLAGAPTGEVIAFPADPAPRETAVEPRLPFGDEPVADAPPAMISPDPDRLPTHRELRS